MIIFRVTTGRSWHRAPVTDGPPLTNPLFFAKSRGPAEQSFMVSGQFDARSTDPIRDVEAGVEGSGSDTELREHKSAPFAY